MPSASASGEDSRSSLPIRVRAPAARPNFSPRPRGVASHLGGLVSELCRSGSGKPLEPICACSGRSNHLATAGSPANRLRARQTPVAPGFLHCQSAPVDFGSSVGGGPVFSLPLLIMSSAELLSAVGLRVPHPSAGTCAIPRVDSPAMLYQSC